ncbi:MAG TPA: hypothetical protein VEQ40_13915, partial [Pyrinomonadaceae bacterium]|nr:hypothetical protein [Pyrinomonadaceae bacterium]
NGHHVFSLMVELNKQHGATLVLITHDHELAAQATRRLSLRDGRVVADSFEGVSESSHSEETIGVAGS